MNWNLIVMVLCYGLCQSLTTAPTKIILLVEKEKKKRSGIYYLTRKNFFSQILTNS